MATQSISQNPGTIFGSTEQVCQTVGTLLRLVQLEDALPKSRNRQQAVDGLSALWQKHIDKTLPPSSMDAVKKEIESDLKGLDSKFSTKFSTCNISTVYNSEIQAAQTTTELQKCALRFFKDTKSIQISPMTRAFRGVNGPTFLVNYPRPNSDLKSSLLHNYVMKWSSWTEACSARLYDGFARNFNTDETNPTFIIPETAVIDLEDNIHEATDTSHYLLTAKVVEKLRSKFLGVIIESIIKEIRDGSKIERSPEGVKKSLLLLSTEEFNFLISKLSKEESKRLVSLLFSEKMHLQLSMIPLAVMESLLGLFTPKEAERMREKLRTMNSSAGPSSALVDTKILLIERIPGANIFDFAKEKYKTLSKEQKQKLFERMGRLAFLDVVMGNQDRLIQVFYNKENRTFELSNFESNLGNAMIVWSGQEQENPQLYAIDNGIGEKLIKDPEHKKKYLQFLETLYSDPQMAKRLTESMAASIQSCLDTQCDEELETDEEIDVRKIKAELKPFRDDLNDQGIAQPAIRRGIEEMAERLRLTLVPAWESEKAAPLKNHLLWAYPELLEAVSERLETLKSSRTLL